MATRKKRRKKRLPLEDEAARGVKDPSTRASSRGPGRAGRSTTREKNGGSAAAPTQPDHSRVGPGHSQQSEQAGGAGLLEPQVSEGRCRCHPAARGSLQEAELHQVGLVNV